MSLTEDATEAMGDKRKDEGIKRRRWSLAQKLAVVAESNGKSTNLSAVARRHGITPAQLYRWRKSFTFEDTPLATKDYTVFSRDGGLSTLNRELAHPYIEIQLMDGRRLIFSSAVEVEFIANLIKAIDT